ncbi:MAG TPA: hypothetical protein VGY56_11390 [Verrucomicrobiae bacterium]|nr:hypothetical protein [Verrucomicrobiae bacterium]
MKANAPKSRGKNTPKSSTKQGLNRLQFGQIAESTGFTIQQLLAIEMLAVFEGGTLRECFHVAVKSYIETAICEIDQTSLADETPDGRAADRLLACVLPMLAGIIEYKRSRKADEECRLLRAAGVIKPTVFDLIYCPDADLHQMSVSWPVKLRRSMAEKFSNWASNLRATADLMDGQSSTVNIN